MKTFKALLAENSEEPKKKKRGVRKATPDHIVDRLKEPGKPEGWLEKMLKKDDDE